MKRARRPNLVEKGPWSSLSYIPLVLCSPRRARITNLMQDSTKPEFRWHAQPAAERLSAAIAGAAIVLALAGAAWLAGGSIWWAVLTTMVLLGSLRRFYLPSVFSIDDEGITARSGISQRRMVWRDVRRFVVDDAGGFLSTRSKHSWFDAGRGLHILFGHDRPDVIERIRAHIPKGHVPWPG